MPNAYDISTDVFAIHAILEKHYGVDNPHFHQKNQTYATHIARLIEENSSILPAAALRQKIMYFVWDAYDPQTGSLAETVTTEILGY